MGESRECMVSPLHGRYGGGTSGDGHGACGQAAVQPSGELTVEATLNDAVGHTLVVLVTKYHLGWMAYADADHGYLTVDWNWLLDTTRSGSGLANAGRVLAP
jgi:hypothetical protein